MIMTEEQGILKAQEQFEQILDLVRQDSSKARRIDQVESDLWAHMLELGRCLLEGFERTAEDVVDQLLRKTSQKQRPRPQNKKLRAELPRPIAGRQVNGKDCIFGWFAEQIRCRNGDHHKSSVCVMDGDRAL